MHTLWHKKHYVIHKILGILLAFSWKPKFFHKWRPTVINCQTGLRGMISPKILKTRRAKSKTRKHPISVSTIPFHHATTGHSFKFEDTIILERERNKFKHMVLEGMHIYSNKDSVVNINLGLTIDNCWAPFVKRRHL